MAENTTPNMNMVTYDAAGYTNESEVSYKVAAWLFDQKLWNGTDEIVIHDVRQANRTMSDDGVIKSELYTIIELTTQPETPAASAPESSERDAVTFAVGDNVLFDNEHEIVKAQVVRVVGSGGYEVAYNRTPGSFRAFAEAHELTRDSAPQQHAANTQPQADSARAGDYYAADNVEALMNEHMAQQLASNPDDALYTINAQSARIAALEAALEEAISALDKICNYYPKSEPTNMKREAKEALDKLTTANTPPPAATSAVSDALRGSLEAIASGYTGDRTAAGIAGEALETLNASPLGQVANEWQHMKNLKALVNSFIDETENATTGDYHDVMVDARKWDAFVSEWRTLTAKH